MTRRILPGLQGNREYPTAEDFAGKKPTVISTLLDQWASKLDASSRVAERELPPDEWIEKHFLVDRPRDPVTADLFEPGPVRLAEYQKRILRAALERTPDGKLKYNTIVWSEPKKSGKTTIAAAIAMYMAQRHKSSNIYCLANDGKQSQDRIFKAMDSCIKLHAKHGGLFESVRPIWAPPSFKLDNGTVVEAIPCDAAGEAGSEPLMTVWCFDNRTEVLTKDGWKGCEVMSMSDQIATLDQHGMFEWQKPTGINKMYYVGRVWKVETRRVSLCVTPQHRIYGKFCKSNDRRVLDQADWDVKIVDEATKWERVNLRTSCQGWVGSIPDNIPEVRQDCYILPATARKSSMKIPLKLFVRFLGWYLAEGCVQRKQYKPEGVDIAQSKHANPEKRQEIIDLFHNMGFENVHEWKDDMTVIVYDARLGEYCNQFGLSRDKFIPEWVKNLPTDYLEELLEAYLNGDGHVDTHNTLRGTTTSKKLADDLMEVGQKLGFGINSIHSNGPNGYEEWVICFHHQSTWPSPSIYKNQWHEDWYIGPAWCPSVPNHIIYVRRDGRAYWMGNSEMWGYRQEAKERLWTEMTIPPTLYGYAMRWIESYAGYEDESTILWNLYDNGVNHGAQHPQLMDLPVYTNGDQFTFWSHEARMPWQTKQYYESEAKLMLPNEFLRIHRNQWVSATISLLDNMVTWDRCRDDIASGPLRPGDTTPIVIALDASVSGDACAVVGVSRHPDDEWDAPLRRVVVRHVSVYYPPAGGKINYSETLEPEVRLLSEMYNVYKVVYDPYQLHKMCTDLSYEGVAAFEEFDQTRRRSKADKQLYDMIIMRQLLHNGDPELRRHVQACAAKSEGASMTLRLTKKANGRPIDLAVALSMATDEVLRLNV